MIIVRVNQVKHTRLRRTIEIGRHIVRGKRKLWGFFKWQRVTAHVFRVDCHIAGNDVVEVRHA